MNISSILAGATILTLAGPTALHAQTTCSVATVVGSYAVHGQGWVGTFALSPEIVVGERYFDGKGGFTGFGHQSLAGESRFFKITGTYTVSAGCAINIVGESTTTTAPIVTSAPDHWYGLVTDAGNKIVVSRTDHGFTTETEFERVVPVY